MNRSFQRNRLERIGKRLLRIEMVLKKMAGKPLLKRRAAKLRGEWESLRSELRGQDYSGDTIQGSIDNLDAATRRLRDKLGLGDDDRD